MACLIPLNSCDEETADTPGRALMRADAGGLDSPTARGFERDGWAGAFDAATIDGLRDTAAGGQVLQTLNAPESPPNGRGGGFLLILAAVLLLSRDS